jgi:hypothetical protein
MARGKGEFRNIKLGKNVYRQLKRQGSPQRVPVRSQGPKTPQAEKPAIPRPPSPAILPDRSEEPPA